MIAWLSGKIRRRHPSEIVLDVAGVGYRVSIPLSTFCNLPSDGENASLEIHTIVRDDAILLYGFGTSSERQLFEALLSVSGVGPKVGLAILSGLAAGEIVRAVESRDAPRLQSVPGVGRKLAERIVLELKEKITRISAAAPTDGRPAPPDADEAESALLHLGYAQAEARRALERVQRETQGAPLPLETILREALKRLAQ